MTSKITPHCLAIVAETEKIDLTRQENSVVMMGLLDHKDQVICARDECILMKDREIAHWKKKVDYLGEMATEI